MRLALEAGAGGVAAVAAVLLLAAAWALHLRRSRAGRGLAALRALAAAALALAVLHPVIALTSRRLVRPRLLVLVDAAGSMRGRGVGSPTRLSQAADWLRASRGEIERRAEVTVALVSDRARAVRGIDDLSSAATTAAPFAAAEALTDAASALTAAPTRVWLLSDGVAEGGSDLGQALAGLGAPVDALGVGAWRRERGVAVTELTTPDFAFLHGRISVEAALEASGLAGKKLSVTLARADEAVPGGWREAAREERTVLTDPEEFVSSFTATAERLGAERWRLRMRGDGIVFDREFRIEVVRQKYRIMYLAGRPSTEYSFLREFLKSDPNYELVSFVILRNPENPSPGDDRELSLIPFPMDDIFARTLPQFDLFILENFSAARFRMPPAYLENLRRFVSAGGALLVKGGENAFAAGGYKGSPLEDALPVVLSSRSPDFIPGLFAPELPSYEHPLVKLFETDADTRRAWAALPDLDGWGRFAATRPGAQVAASHPTQTSEDGKPLAVIAVRPYGRGKVMLVSTDSTWRWKLGAAADRLASGVYERFWARSIQYLTGTLDLSKVKFAPLPDRIPPREPFTASLRVFGEDFTPADPGETRLSVVWTKPDGKSVEVPARAASPGVYEVELTGLAPGAHRLRANARVRGRDWGFDEKRFVWEQSVEAPMDRAWLSKTAALSGGSFYDLSRTPASELLARLPAPRPEDATVRRLHPFASPGWLALCGLLLLGEWAWRRRRGHV